MYGFNKEQMESYINNLKRHLSGAIVKDLKAWEYLFAAIIEEYKMEKIDFNKLEITCHNERKIFKQELKSAIRYCEENYGRMEK